MLRTFFVMVALLALAMTTARAWPPPFMTPLGGGISAPTPTPTPTAPPPSFPPPTAPTYNGCPVFPANDPTWNVNIAGTTADANSAAFFSGMTSVASTWDVFVNHSAAFWDINQATNVTPLYSYTTPTFVLETYGITTFPFLTSYQWQDKLVLGEHHLMVVNSANCNAYEAYSSMDETTSGVSWSPAPSPHATALVDVQNRQKAMQYSLSAPFPTPLPISNTQQGGGSVQLLGPLFPTLVRWEDFQNDSPHAIGVDVPTASMLFNTFVYPAKFALGTTFGGSGSPPPLGARFYLKATAALPSCYRSDLSGTCPAASFIINCMLRYGGYLVDQGAAGFTIRLGNKADGTDPWGPYDTAADLKQLNSLAVNATNFAFIAPPYCASTITACEGVNPTPPPPTPTPGGPLYNGCSVFTANDWFDTNLTTGGSTYVPHSVDPASAAIMSNLVTALGNVPFDLVNDAGTIVVNGATNSTPVLTATSSIWNDVPYNDNPTNNKIPWAAGSFYAEKSLTACSGDCHAIVMTPASNPPTGTNPCIDYEAYSFGSFVYSGGNFTATGQTFNFGQSYNSQIPTHVGIGNAAGLPMVPIVDWGEDASATTIMHVGTILLPAVSSGAYIGVKGHVPPANTQALACSTDCTNALPMGARLQLKASYNCAALDTQAKLVCIQWQTYGVSFMDTFGAGNAYLQSYFGTSLNNSASPWSGSQLYNTGTPGGLNNIHLNDFQVITLCGGVGTSETTPSCTGQ